MSRFSGLPAHVEQYVGRVRGPHSTRAGDRDRGYYLVYCDHPDRTRVSVLTSGLRDYTAGAPLPQELICTLRSEQEKYARHLTAVIAELLTETQSRVGYGALIMNDRILLPDTEISGARAAPHPYLDDAVDIPLHHAGAPALQLNTVVPTRRGEHLPAARQGP